MPHDTSKTKRPKIKLLEWPFATFNGDGSDFIIDFKPSQLHDLPVFSQNGWYMLTHEGKTRTWYQIQGKTYATDDDRLYEDGQKNSISHFKWQLRRLDETEHDIGVEKARQLETLWPQLPRCYRAAIGKPVRAHREIQQLRDTLRETKLFWLRYMERREREREAAK
jgi:hypothetical protein